MDEYAALHAAYDAALAATHQWSKAMLEREVAAKTGDDAALATADRVVAERIAAQKQAAAELAAVGAELAASGSDADVPAAGAAGALHPARTFLLAPGAPDRPTTNDPTEWANYFSVVANLHFMRGEAVQQLCVQAVDKLAAMTAKLAAKTAEYEAAVASNKALATEVAANMDKIAQLEAQAAKTAELEAQAAKIAELEAQLAKLGGAPEAE